MIILLAHVGLHRLSHKVDVSKFPSQKYDEAINFESHESKVINVEPIWMCGPLFDCT